MRLLILGGTTEATALVRRLAGRADIDAVLSFAGRTRAPVLPPIPFRIGGFGGVAGLMQYLTKQQIDVVVDATHPFATQMSHHAAEACGQLRVPLAVLSRPAWVPQQGDRWIRVASMEAAVDALGLPPRTVFLTVGGLQLAAFAQAPQHRYIVRTIDAPEAIGALPRHRLILARGPFGIDDEIALMRAEGVAMVVTKNSGGAATRAKLTAARTLGIDVVMVERPTAGQVPAFFEIPAVLAWIEAHRLAP